MAHDDSGGGWEADPFDLFAGDDVKEAEKTITYKDFILFLVDARRSMYERTPKGQTFLGAALGTIATVMKQHAMNETSVRIGVMLMGTERVRNDNNFEGVYLLCPVAPVSPDVIRSLLRHSADHTELLAEAGALPAGRPLPVPHALWACSSLLRATRPVDKKKVWVLTNDDAPGASVADSEVRAADAWAAGIEILVLPMLAPGRAAFDAGAFWGRLVASEEEDTRGVGGGVVVEVDLAAAAAAAAAGGGGGGGEGDEVVTAGSRRLRTRVGVQAATADGSWEGLSGSFRMRAAKKRVHTRLAWTLTGGVHIGIGVYNLIAPAKKPTPKYVARDTQLPVRSFTRHLDSTTGEKLEAHQLLRYTEIGGERVVFTEDEAKDMKRVSSGDGRGLRLVGFKPAAAIKDFYNIRPAVFVYPSERDVVGSTLTFRALWQRMLEGDIAAICRYEPRDQSQIRFMALLATAERLSDAGEQEAPPGMFGILLPFADDIRRPLVPPAEPAPDAAVEAASALVQRLRLQPGLDLWTGLPHNPTLQKFYAGLEALALNLEMTWSEDADDESMPAKVDFSELAAFRDACGLAADGSDPLQPAKAPVKRRAAAAAAGEDDGPAEDAGVDWAAEVAAGTVGRRGITLAMLKAYLARAGLRVSGNKGELTERVTQHVAANSEGGAAGAPGGGGSGGATGDTDAAAAVAPAKAKRARK